MYKMVGLADGLSSFITAKSGAIVISVIVQLLQPLILHIGGAHGIYLQIVAPYRGTERMDSVIADGLRDARGWRSPIRRARLTLETGVKRINDQTPDEIMEVFCDNIFYNNASVILSINYDTFTSGMTEYIIKSAKALGYPIISWDPFYPGALESVEDNMVLQIGPTIYHECEGIIRLMERYNWTDFSIVTTTEVATDFIDCMEYQVNKTSLIQGFLTKPKYRNIATVVLNLEGFPDFFGDNETAYVKQELKALKKAKSRIILLHVKDTDALNVVEVAEEMDLTGSTYGWILTSSSAGSVANTGTRLPLGFLAVGRAANKSLEAVETALRMWTEAVKTMITNGDHLNLDMEPYRSCASWENDTWTDGLKIYKYLKGVSLKEEGKTPISFTSRGIIEHVELTVLNVRPGVKEIKRRGGVYYRKIRVMDTVGRIFPQMIRRELKMQIETKEIVWPGERLSPPIGRPERRFFRIVTRQEEPFVIYVPPEDDGECGHYSVRCMVNSWNTNENETTNSTINYCCTGLCIEVLQRLSEDMMFDYELYDVPDGQWGVQDPVTGEWNGLVKEILDDRADMILTSFLINQLRSSVLDFSVPFLESGITIMVSIRKGAISPYAFLEPYDVSSWVLILIFSVHATGASIFIFEWLSPSGLDRGKTSTVEHKFSLFRSFWLIWAMLFGAAVSIDVPRGVSSRFLANVWALFALVFLASYTANLAAFMITIDEYYDLSGIEDWRLKYPTTLTPHFKFATIANSSTDVNLKQNYFKMSRYMSKYSQPNLELAKKNLKNNTIHAFIYDANVLEYIAGRDEECSLLTVGRWYAMSGYGVALKVGSEIKDEVDTNILKLQHSGEIERLQAFWLSGACHAKKDKKNKSNSKIEILNFISAFILLAAGVLLGVILLILEHLYFKSGRKCLKKYDKWGCCALVSLSMGKSLTFEQSVFEAIDIQRKHKCKDPICEMNLWRAKHQLDMALLKIRQIETRDRPALTSRLSSSTADHPISSA